EALASSATCEGTLLSSITHTTTGASGIGTVSGLPPGVTAAWASNTITIGGTPSLAGSYHYMIPLTGGCGSVNATGNITVSPSNTVSAPSSTPVLCVNNILPTITHTTTGATGIGLATGLPASVTPLWSDNTITISGVPTEAGVFNYRIPLTGGCDTLTATGNITVGATNTAGAASASPTVCMQTALTNITHSTVGATGIGTASGLPNGLIATWASNTITISGTPTQTGSFSYSIPLTGGCGLANATGNITVISINSAGNASLTNEQCVNNLLTSITHTTSGATGIGMATGLPGGLNAIWKQDTITISGTPTEQGTFNYTIPLTGGCGNINATGIVTIRPENTVSAPSSSQTLCVKSALTDITHVTTGAVDIVGTATGLPAGVTALWSSNMITISGTPTESGTFNYAISLVGGCGNAKATGTIIVTPENTVSVPSSTGQVCVNKALTNIIHTTTGATGIGIPDGLPSGVTASWASGTITISGTPDTTGDFSYAIPLTGGCDTLYARGIIRVVKSNTVSASSNSPTLCVGTTMSNITHVTSGATGIGISTGLPAGVSAQWTSNLITISGTPTESGIFNYNIPLTGGCDSVKATGTITVTPANTVSPSSTAPTLCINTTLTNITHKTTGATGIGNASGLPEGVIARWQTDSLIISGKPTASGTFNYLISLTGGCDTLFARGTIIVRPKNTVGVASSTPVLCVKTILPEITHTTSGATGIGVPSGLPSGVTATWTSGMITINGKPDTIGILNI
ncbi:MAG: beta strand repeat-containing protein, partial [Bacteroidota bacterium]